MRRILTLLMIIAVSGAAAQERFDYVFRRNPWNGGPNAAGIRQDSLSRSYAEIYFTKETGGMTGHSSSDASWNAGARTESVRHLNAVYKRQDFARRVGFARKEVFLHLRADDADLALVHHVYLVDVTACDDLLRVDLLVVGRVSHHLIVALALFVACLLYTSASAAIIMLIFRDSILGFVSGIQLSANDMLKVGDWISVPKYGADGSVIEVSLTTVKVRNFDNTIVTLPPYLLVSDSFQNWRGMQASGEMCIRDRHGSRGSGRFGDFSGGQLRRAAQPVSYTHLPAGRRRWPWRVPSKSAPP